jgi:hypothetical protein
MGGGGRRGGRSGGGGEGGGNPGGTGGPGGGGGGHRRGGGDADSGTPGQDPAEDGEHRDPFAAAHDVKITVAGPQLTLTNADGTPLSVLYTDGRKQSEEKEGVGTVKTQAQWKDGALEVVTKLPKGKKKTEIYEITHDRKRLYVLTTLEGFGKMPEVTFRRVYDPVVPPPPAAAPPGSGLEEEDEIVEDF